MRSARVAVVLSLGLWACGEDSPGTGGGDDAATLDGGAGDLGGLEAGDLAEEGTGDAATEDAATADSAGEDGAGEDGAADAADEEPAGEPPATIGGDRPATVYVPLDWASRADWPLIVLLHGYGVNGNIQNLYLGLSQRVDEAGFVLLTPDGTENATAQRFWNASDFCCDFAGQNVDDVAYISGLIEEAVERLRVDPARVYLFGHSNGGFMSYRMACDRAELVTGIAVLAGAMLSDDTECEPARPVSVLHIHGTADTTILYDGSELGAGHPSAEESLQWWREHDGCAADETQQPDADYDSVVSGDETDRLSWLDCDGEARADLWKMEGVGHTPAFNDDFRDDVVEHLLGFRSEP